MHLAQHAFRVLAGGATVAALACALTGTAMADRMPLIGSAQTQPVSGTRSITSTLGTIVAIDPLTVPCTQGANFDEVNCGPTPGLSIDGIFASGDMTFAERFAGQTVESVGLFDAIAGAPSNPLTLQAGLSGQNLNVFSYWTNVLTGLGPLGFPEMDAIGEGSISMRFATGQSRVALEIVGGNGGWATLEFYRADGTLIDSVYLNGLYDQPFGFQTADGTPVIAGILVQTGDESGIGIDNICHSAGVDNARVATWGSLKAIYR
jgi:hypothetical protein